MTDQADPLKAAGIPRLDPDVQPDLYAELYRIARRIRESERTVVGLLPTGPDVAVPPLMVGLGFSLTDACEGKVAVVDANTRWPALSSVAAAGGTRSKKSGFLTTWLDDSLALVTPPDNIVTRGMKLEGLDYLLREESVGFIHSLVDLTGFEHVGEHWGMFDIIDGVLLVGHPGRTHERDLLRIVDDLPEGRALGVVLVG